MDKTQTAVRIRQDIAAMDAYTPTASLEVFAEQLGFPEDQLIKLDANENPFGASPHALQALANLADAAADYPDPEARQLRRLLSDYLGVGAEHILVGAGVDDIIALLLQLFIEPGDAIINCPPTFGMYTFDAPIFHAREIKVPRQPDFTLDVEAIEQAARESNAKLLILCSPNNPSGNLLPPETLERLLDLPLVVVLDEAYIEFSTAESMVRRVPQTDNLIVLRTFSKWAGLAGLRVGYGVFPLPLMEHLWKIKQPYNLNVAADVMARASLLDRANLQIGIQQMIEARQRLETELAKFPFLEPFPSQANFVLCRVIGREASELRTQLAADYGILIRYYSKPELRDCVRISSGTPDQITALLNALREIGSQAS